MATTAAKQPAKNGTKHPAQSRVRGGVLAAGLALIVYLNALFVPFVYDDQDTVVNNPSIVHLSNIRFILTHSPFRPVVNASYALDHSIWGHTPVGFHLTNVFLHAAVVLLLFLFLRRACADARARVGGSPAPRPIDDWIAYSAAILFAVHPLLSEAVTYVSGRSELLCGLFFLSTLLLARAAMARGGAFWLAAGVSAVFALLSKEVALALPMVVLAYDWLVFPGEAAARRRRTWFIFAPCVVLLALAAVYRLSVAAGPLSADSPLLNIWTQSIVIWRYLALFFLPVGQSVMHAVHRVTSLVDPKALLALSGLAGLVAFALYTRRSVPLTSFGILWFLLVIAPSSSIVALREGMAEHRAYLASAGIMMALAGLASASRFSSSRERPGIRAVAAVTVVTVALSVLTVVRNELWRKPTRLWRNAVSHAPDMWEPHYVLGDTLRADGDCAAAVAEYEIVVRMRPNHRDGYTNLGICLAQTNRAGEAEAAFRRALEIDPRFARGYTNLGALALITGQPERAREMYLRALEIEPRNVLALMQLAGLYENVFKDFHAAARMCGEARAASPTTPNVAECVERNQRSAAAKDAGK